MYLGSKFTYFSSDDSEEEVRTGNVSSEGSDEETADARDDGQVSIGGLRTDLNSWKPRTYLILL